MAQYYFTVASLPMLALDEQPFYTSGELAEICMKELSSDEADNVRRALEYFATPEVDGTYLGILKTYHRWEQSVRRALATARAQRLGWETSNEITEIEPESEHIARELINQESPYEAELQLQRVRWDKLEELSVGHYFDADSIVLYILKALVIERYRQMDKEDGAERFNEIYSHMVQALSRRPE